MEIRQLKCFVTVAETKSFSKAARQLYVSQSALSQQIKQLEDELRVRLFVRNNHSVSITESGLQLLPMANNILQGVVACHECINEMKHLVYGVLNIGVSFTLEPCLREAMLLFFKEHPGRKINVYYKNVSELLGELHNNRIDIMFSFMPSGSHDFVESIPLMSHRLMVAMRRGHPLSSKTLITHADLCHQRIIMPDTGLSEHDIIGYFLQAETKDLHIISYINNACAILNLLQESNYISILTQSTLLSNPNVCGVPIENVDKTIVSYAHLNRHTPRKHSVNAFLEVFRNTNAFYIIQHP